ncbi:E3 ubiquitin-protein ligase SHPRH isoform X3 [Takifugu rubripes]|nr:E3 ubiquitin-protein ligase SHPRH isoform X3 [Takifugu rubripes]
MGLGKTVEVLSLILCHTRQDLELEVLTLPVGKSVNYFVPPPPLESKKVSCKVEVPKVPKMKTSYPTVRLMLLAAIKEMRTGKGTSVNAIFSYIRSTYGYDLFKNRTHIRKTLAKLISEGLVEQVKGRGLAGSFRLGKNYKETKKMLAEASKFNYKSTESPPRKMFQRRAKEKAETAMQNSFTENESDLYSHVSADQTPTEGEPKEECDPSKHEKADEFADILDMSASKKAADIPDIINTDDAPKEAPQMDLHKDSETPTRASVVPFNTQDYRFECICGELGIVDYKARVQCMNCQLWQHASCVNYKEESLETTPFYCPHCLVAMKPVSTGATLIISPSSICHQWVEEINRHIRSSSLRVLVYQGVKKHGFIQPHMLAEQDVVITTYDVLRSELNYVDIPHSNSKDGRRFRNQKRYMAVPSPLVAVEWWRICLDEAQMVECPTAKAAEMALRLASVNRWCVSGTPVQRGLEDVYGLVLFLGVDPYWVKHWWDQLLYRPYRRGNTEPLYNVIAQLLWRSAKKDVIDQIQIPPQTEEVHWLTFSPVEGHFYHRQHEVCSQDALVKLRKISDWSLKLGSLDRRTVNTILCPLLRLRQACCHPQAVRGEFLPLQKSTMTMEELLKSLQKKCRVECEEAHRQLVCALNGLAGIHIIRNEFLEAAELYREVLRSSEEHKGQLKTDSLQRLHATHNLMELLSAKHPGIPPTLRDDRLSEEEKQLQQHYMTKYDSEVADAHQNLQPVLQNIKELKCKVKLNAPWWLDVIQKAIRCSNDDDLVSRVKNELTCSYKQQAQKLSMADKFRDACGLQFLLTSQMQDLIKSQKSVRDAVKSLEGPASKAVIDEATICHLRPMRLPLNNCVFCKADELFTDYESKLFSHTVKGQTAIFEEMIEDEEGLVDDRLPTTSRGLWAASEMERTLKAILSFAKTKRMEAELVEEGNTFMELFENWKKEYKVLHEYWMVLRNHVSAIDELGMATERLRVRLPDEPKPKLPHIIEPHEVEQNRVKLLNDQAVAKSQLQKKLGQFLYLTNLEKSQDKSTGGLNPEPCPICARPLGQEWAVLTCGHCFCNECIAIIVEQYSVGSRRRAIKCAICRQTTSHAEISYVFTAQSSNQDQEIPVKGSHSTKVEAVVRTLKKIQVTDPGAKCLVFSTWLSVLDIIAKALFDNNMEFSQINGIHKFQENLSSFKYDEKINILLLPLHTGSNGLNIIEATHVLLVEPILNPAHELQAIGRVHRIGQTKPTFVHRFLIRSTIEERMQAMLKTAEKSHTSTSTTMKHSEAAVLTVADLADLFTDDPEHLE